uniref:Uncharacterized protein n=1 Tax=Cyprinus carpio TaxID=7962 RepID=A0A8C1RFL2_CYPCA
MLTRKIADSTYTSFKNRHLLVIKYLHVALKSEIKNLNITHAVVWLLVAAQVMVSQLNLVSHKVVASPYQWEYPYLLSIIPTVFSFVALPKNNISYLVISVISAGLFCVAPIHRDGDVPCGSVHLWLLCCLYNVLSFDYFTSSTWLADLLQQKAAGYCWRIIVFQLLICVFIFSSWGLFDHIRLYDYLTKYFEPKRRSDA